MKSHTLEVLKITDLNSGGAEVELGFDDDFVKFYEKKFKKKLTQKNFQDILLEGIKNYLK